MCKQQRKDMYIYTYFLSKTHSDSPPPEQSSSVSIKFESNSKWKAQRVLICVDNVDRVR